MYKNLLLIIISFLFLNNCGYSPIYSKNIDQKLNVELVDFSGDREINNSIKFNLKRYNYQENELKFFIETNSEYNKSTETKNLAGDTISSNSKISMPLTSIVSVNFNIFFS